MFISITIQFPREYFSIYIICLIIIRNSFGLPVNVFPKNIKKTKKLIYALTNLSLSCMYDLIDIYWPNILICNFSSKAKELFDIL